MVPEDEDEGCPYCGEPCAEGMILCCPTCTREGCPVCMPGGNNCMCPECEADEDEDEIEEDADDADSQADP